MANKNLGGMSLTAPELDEETENVDMETGNGTESDIIPESQFIGQTNISLVSTSENDNSEDDEIDSQDSYLKELTCAQRPATNINEDNLDIPINASLGLRGESGQEPSSGFLPGLSQPTAIVRSQNQDPNEISASLVDNIHAPISTSSHSYQTKAKSVKHPLPPTNRTLESLGKKNVILIQFKSPKNILTNPMLINQLITNSLFNSLNIKDIRTNFKKNLIAIECISPLTDNQIHSLTSITVLGDFEINCYVPNSDLFIFGVIGPISPDIDLDILCKEINDINNCNVIKIDRLKRREQNKWVDSSAIKLTFKLSKLPDVLTLMRIRFKVRRFIPEPMQCYRCQRLGHTSKSCSAKAPRCMLCGGPHEKNTCTSTTRYCVNCKEPHAANSNTCHILRNAKEIEKIRATNQTDYQTARRSFLQSQTSTNDEEFPQLPISSRSTSRTVPFNSNSELSPKTYAKAVQKSQLTNRNILDESPKMKNIETQTDESYFSEQIPKCQISHQNFFLQLRNFIVDILKINTTNENNAAILSLADNAIQNNFGISLVTDKNKQAVSEVVTETSLTKKRKVSQRRETEADSTDVDPAGVVSDSDSSDSDQSNIWVTVEKKLVKRDDENNNVDEARVTRSKSKNKKKSKKKKGTKAQKLK